jgi:hypothetical protein
MVKAFHPTYSAEVYRVTAHHLAPGSRRVVLYDVEAEGEIEDGRQQPTRIANLKVRLPLKMANVDRRHLQPVAAADAVPTIAQRHPGLQLAFHLPFAQLAPAVDDGEADDANYDDLESAVS